MLVMFGLVVQILIVSALTQQQPCVSRDYGNGGTVCVCNSSYCDIFPTPEKYEQPQFLIYTSDKAGLRFHQSLGEFKKIYKSSPHQITIKSEEKYQTIHGWGGAFTDSTGINIKSLNDETREHLMNSYFSEDIGIGYNLCRVPIGGTDFSLRGYSYDDGEADPTLANFNLTQEDFDYKIPFIKKAYEMSGGKLELFASAWTAPKWMKTNGEYAGFGFLRSEMYQIWADYFLKFLEAYQKENITFWGITTANEPSLGYIPTIKINSVGWTPSQISNWVAENLGPTIRNSSFKNIKIIALDDQRFFLPWAINIAFRNNKTREFIDGIAVHWYYDSYFPVSLLAKTHDHYPEKFILATEACHGNKPGQVHVELGSWDRGEKYSEDIIEDLQNWVTGWIDWCMALDLTGGPTYISNFVDSPIIVNATAGEFYKQPMFYHLGHFTKFIEKGSIRILSETFDDEVPNVAFRRPDNGTVLVILNKKNEKINVTILDENRGLGEVVLSEKSISTVLYW